MGIYVRIVELFGLIDMKASKDAHTLWFEVKFELKDRKKFEESYPNFHLNYSDFENFARTTISNMMDELQGIKGIDISYKLKAYQK